MTDPVVLDVGIAGTADAAKQFAAMIASMVEASKAFTDAMSGSSEEMEKLGETIEKLGKSSDEAGDHIHEMGQKSSAAGASFKLLQTGVTGAVEVLTGGGFQAGIGVVRELGEEVEATASHFGVMGEAIGAAALRLGVFATVVGGIAVALYELANHAKESTLGLNAFAGAMGVGLDQAVQLRDRMKDFGLTAAETEELFTRMSLRIQAAWQDIQNEIRDAASHIKQDELEVAAAGRAVEEAQINIRDSAMATAAAEQEASSAQIDAERAHAEAVVNASEAVIAAKEAEFDAYHKVENAERSAAEAQINLGEAVIRQKEAEFDAQHKVEDAARDYKSAVVDSNEAQMNLADAQKEFEYAGDDAWRSMKDAIDAVADAERKAADEATAVQQALLQIDEAATSVKSAYVSLYAAQLAYREAHGGGKITAAERQEMRRAQTEVGLESAQERVRGAEFQYARTRRDAIPEAEEAQGRAARGVQAAKEAEDKASLKYAESAQRAADKLEKAGIAASEALEKVAKAALEFQLAPQKAALELERANLGVQSAFEGTEKAALELSLAAEKAANELNKAQLGVQRAEAGERKTGFAATQAAAKAEDALELARIRQREAIDKLKEAEIARTNALNKQSEDFANNIKNVLQYLQTGVGPAGFDVSKTRPRSFERALQSEAGGSMGGPKELDALVAALRESRITQDQANQIARLMGVTIKQLSDALFQAQLKAGQPIIQTPTDAQKKEAKETEAALPGAEALEKAQLDAAKALDRAATSLGDLLTGPVVRALQHPYEAAATGLSLAAGFQILMGRFTTFAAQNAANTARIEARLAETAGKAVLGGAAIGGLEAGILGILSRAFAPLVIGTLIADAVRGGVAALTGHDIGDKGGIAQIDRDVPLLAAIDNLASKIPLLGKAIPVMSYEEQQKQAAAKNAEEGKAAEKQNDAAKDNKAAADTNKETAEKTKEVATKAEDSTDKFDKAVDKFADSQKGPDNQPPQPEPKAGGAVQDVNIVSQEKPVSVTSFDQKPEDQHGPQGTQDVNIASQSNPVDVKVVGGMPDPQAAAPAAPSAADTALTDATTKLGADLGNVASNLDKSISTLTDTVSKLIEGFQKGAQPGPSPQATMKDSVDKVKEAIDKLTSDKGLIQAPKEPGARREYDEAVRHLVESLTKVNDAQKGLIEEQTRATEEGEKLTQEQEKLTDANTAHVREQTTDGHQIAEDQEQLIRAQVDKVRQETADEHALTQARISAIEHCGVGGVGGGGGGGGGGAAAGGGGGPVGEVGGGGGGGGRRSNIPGYAIDSDGFEQPSGGRRAGAGYGQYDYGQSPAEKEAAVRGGEETRLDTILNAPAESMKDAAADLKNAAEAQINAADKQKQDSGHAAGGPVTGPGGIDNVPIMATAGEYVVNAASTSKHRSLLERINSGEPIHFQWGGLVPGAASGIPSTGALQEALTRSSGIGPGGYMSVKTMSQRNQTYEVDLRTDHGVFSVLATDDQMATLQQSSISAKIASTGIKPSWWS